LADDNLLHWPGIDGLYGEKIMMKIIGEDEMR